MRFYNHQHRFYCGVDRHARTMYVCVLDQAGNIVLHKDLPAEPAAFLEAIAPYREGLVVACECPQHSSTLFRVTARLSFI